MRRAAARQEAGGRRRTHTPCCGPFSASPKPDLERELLRKSVGAQAAGRASCDDCGRTPLVGERVHRFGDGALICDLCRPRRDDLPERSEVVHHSERGHTVRRRAA